MAIPLLLKIMRVGYRTESLMAIMTDLDFPGSRGDWEGALWLDEVLQILLMIRRDTEAGIDLLDYAGKSNCVNFLSAKTNP